jgi:hypothetical protein
MIRMEKLYIIRGGAGGGYCNNYRFNGFVISENEYDAVEVAREYAYNDCVSSGVADSFIEEYENDNDGEYPDQCEIDEEIESWMSYSADDATKESLLELYEDGEISQDEYKRYSLMLTKGRVI